MTKPRTFRVATDDAIIALIEEARARLVVIAPALSRAVADALAARFYHSRDEKGKTACLPSGNQAEIFSRLVKLGAV